MATKIKKFGDEDHLAIRAALIRWWKSQEVHPADAAYVMADLIGELIGDVSDDRKTMMQGLEILVKVMLRAGKRELND